MEDGVWCVYMLLCGDGTLYTGITNKLANRLALHQQGRGAKYTKGRGPLQLVYTEGQPDKPSALRREYQIKHLTRAQKDALCAAWTSDGLNDV